MRELRAFGPLYVTSTNSANGTLSPSVTVSASGTAGASAVFPGTVTRNNEVQIQIANQAATWAFVNFGQFGAVTAATVAASYPVAPGAVVVVSVSGEVSGASVILASSTGSVTFTRGEGT